MTQTTSAKWERYGQALLTALGCAALEGREQATVYRLLVIPTFNAPCAFEFTLSDSTGAFRYATLPSVTNPIADYLWNASPAAEVSAIEEAMFSCLDLSVPLDHEASQSLMARLAGLRPPTVNADDLAAKDGASIRLDRRDSNGSSTLRAQLASTRASGDLSAWLTVFFETADAHCHDKRLRELLNKVRSNFFDRP